MSVDVFPITPGLPAHEDVSDALSQAQPKKTLYKHVDHPYQPTNVAEKHRAKRAGLLAERNTLSGLVGAFNLRIALLLTNGVGTMLCAYLFALIGIMSLVGVFANNTFLVLLFGSISSYFLQLVLLPVLAVGSNTISAQQEAQAQEAYQATLRSLHGEHEIRKHLDAQDIEALAHGERLDAIEAKLDLILKLLNPDTPAS